MEVIKQIAEGFGNLLNPKEESERIAKARAEICAACPEKRITSCGVCGCVLSMMIRATYTKGCPKKKWSRAERGGDDGLPKVEQPK